VAPFFLHSQLVAKITALGAGARAGKNARIVLKMNALTDELLIRSLIKAGQYGVKIDLLVRGACMLPARLPGQTDNIRVRSVIGRFLEHSRVFYFRMGEVEELYLSSADWMNRNMVRRVEICWPVTNPILRQRLIDECLLAYLHDGVDAWDMQSDGSYLPVSQAASGHSAQHALMMRYGALS
jgi:polyphosphate kinase